MIIFVGDRPSNKNLNPNVAFIGTPSYKNLQKWIEILKIQNYKLINSFSEEDKQTLLILNNKKDNKFIALGKSASLVLKMLQIRHYKLPHPSPRNRMLNDNCNIERILNDCRKELF